MDDLRLRFRDADQPDFVLGPGVHALGRLSTGLGAVTGGDDWLLRVCNDRRGVWMTVADGLRGVHVNGRPVQQLCLLRAGDCVHVDGAELQLIGSVEARALPSAGQARDPIGNLRLVLRGCGGPHHGRAISLERPRRFGSATDADVRLDGPGIAPVHAVVEVMDGQPVLGQLAGDVLVNGQRGQPMVLRSGDQLAFGVQHRFVVEAPPPTAAPLPRSDAFADDAPLTHADGPRRWTQRVPWLLVAALALAASLSALLLFGAG